ncbi:MAG: UDP-3-O-(3-hydroxymyristoyl)glucosamine N-acyltransferase [Planctomycetota bacterium]
MATTVSELAKLVDGEVAGDGSLGITGATSPASGRPDSITFAENDAALEAALTGDVGAVVVGRDVEAETDKVLVRTDHARVAFAFIAAKLHPEPTQRPGVHPTAVVHESAIFGADVSIGAGCVIEADVSIGDRTVLLPRVVVREGAVVGPDCRLHPGVTLYPGVTLGAGVIVHAGSVLGSDGFGYVETPERKVKFPQVGTLVIGDDVEIGANCTIDRGALDATVIGKGSKLDNLVHLAHNVVLGERVALSAQVGMAGTATIGNYVFMGGQCGIGDHSFVGDGVILAGKTVVASHKKLPGNETYWGIPAVPIRKKRREIGEVARLGKLRERVKALEKRVEELS